jgi:hypothetical protein
LIDEEKEMANESETEKDNFWLYIGGLIVVTVILVLILKGRETESVPYQAHSELKAQLEKHTTQNK